MLSQRGRGPAPGTAVISGASAGTGRAASPAFARRGWGLGRIARGAEGLEAARREAKAAGRHGPLPCPRTSRVRRTAPPGGGIDVRVNCAKATVFAPAHAMSPAEYRMPRRAQPMPPIHQPEAVAEHTYYTSALKAPRELWVGMAGLTAILGTMFAPGLLDRVLARRGHDGPMTEEPEIPGRPDNLFAPLPGDPALLHVTAGFALGALVPLALRGAMAWLSAPPRRRWRRHHRQLLPRP